MAGNLIVSKINGGQIGFRNILINGLVNTPYEINQRNLAFSEVSDGEYFADRWKRVNALNMTQIVEEGNYKPETEYCLSGTGVATQVLNSPASGNWTLPNIPSTASYIQLEEGDDSTEFEWRSVEYELSLCQRYYYEPSPTISTQVMAYAEQGRRGNCNFTVCFPVTMRTTPSVSFPQTGDPANLPNCSADRRVCDSFATAEIITTSNFGSDKFLKAIWEFRWANAEL